jgi:hypothetical protein
MISPDETTQTTDVLERIPLQLDRKKFINERRQSRLQQKQTDVLPTLTSETAAGKIASRQMIQLREENRRLQREVEEYRSEIERLNAALNAAQAQFDTELETIHSGHFHEIEQYQHNLCEFMEERNQLQDAYFDLQQRYQELEGSDPVAIEEEVQKRISAALETLDHSPEETPEWLKNIERMMETRVRRKEDQYIAEAHALKRDLQHIAAQLEQERKEVAVERQNAIALQKSIGEQAKQRERLLAMRLHARSTMRVTVTASILVLLLVAIQFTLLGLLHIHLTLPLTLTLFVPILVCIGAAPFLASRLAFAKYIYMSAPHKKTVKK